MRHASRLIALAVGVLGWSVLSMPVSGADVAVGVERCHLPVTARSRGWSRTKPACRSRASSCRRSASSTVIGVTDRLGRFRRCVRLTPGPYLVRARISGFSAPRGQTVQVLSSTPASSSIALRRLDPVRAGRLRRSCRRRSADWRDVAGGAARPSRRRRRRPTAAKAQRKAKSSGVFVTPAAAS